MVHTPLLMASAGAALALAGCAPAKAGGALDDATQCRIMVDLAGQLKADNYNPRVGRIDCRAAFAAAGLPMHGLRGKGDRTGPRHIVEFEPAQTVGGGTVALRLAYQCLYLCGHGEEVTAKRRSGRWTITARKTTWVS